MTYLKILYKVSASDFRSSNFFLHQVIRRQQSWHKVHKFRLEFTVDIYERFKKHVTK